MSSPKIIAIIPARGGSKGILRKNIKLLAGKPMISYIIETVKSIRTIDRIVVSTEDEEIASIAKDCGAEVPWLRPMDLAGDDVPTLPVIQHALSELERSEQYFPDYVLLVYPTSPLLSAERIEQAISLALAIGADSVVSGTSDGGHYWIEGGAGKYVRLYPAQIANRQLLKPIFRENGAIYFNKVSVLKDQIVGAEIVPLFMEDGEVIDIDTPLDFDQAELALLQRRNISLLSK